MHRIALLVIVLGLGLAGCDMFKSADKDVKKDTDKAMTDTDKAVKDVGSDVKKGTDDTVDQTKKAVNDM